jgi:hypothetical protein
MGAFGSETAQGNSTTDLSLSALTETVSPYFSRTGSCPRYPLSVEQMQNTKQQYSVMTCCQLLFCISFSIFPTPTLRPSGIYLTQLGSHDRKSKLLNTSTSQILIGRMGVK